MALGHWLKDYIGPHSGGSGGGAEPLIVNVVKDETTGVNRLDHTWQEIYDAPIAYLHLESYGLAELPARLSLIYIWQARSQETGDVLYCVSFGSDPTMRYNADSDDGYPQEDEG